MHSPRRPVSGSHSGNALDYGIRVNRMIYTPSAAAK